MGLLENPARTLGGGRKTVTAAGTAVALASSNADVISVAITAESDNTGLIAVGDSSVDATVGAQTNGILLTAGQTATFDVSDLTRIYIDSTVNGDGVTYVYLEA